MFSTIFNDTSAEIKTKSADLLLKMTTILKERATAIQKQTDLTNVFLTNQN